MSWPTLVDPNDPEHLHHKPSRRLLAVCQANDGPHWRNSGVCSPSWAKGCARCWSPADPPATAPDRPVQRAADGPPGDDDDWTGSEYVDRIGARRVLAWLRRWLT